MLLHGIVFDIKNMYPNTYLFPVANSYVATDDSVKPKGMVFFK